jgi:hypothetical protein
MTFFLQAIFGWEISTTQRHHYHHHHHETVRRQASHEETFNHTAEKQNSIYAVKALNAMIED